MDCCGGDLCLSWELSAEDCARVSCRGFEWCVLSGAVFRGVLGWEYHEGESCRGQG